MWTASAVSREVSGDFKWPQMLFPVGSCDFPGAFVKHRPASAATSAMRLSRTSSRFGGLDLATGYLSPRQYRGYKYVTRRLLSSSQRVAFLPCQKGQNGHSSPAIKSSSSSMRRAHHNDRCDNFLDAIRSYKFLPLLADCWVFCDSPALPLFDR